MEREELLRNPEWWLANIQNDLYGIIYEYMNKNKLKKKDIADKLNVSKGYVTQILSGDFDHKISKLVELSLAFGKAPKVSYLDIDQYIKDDVENKVDENNRHKRPIQNILSIDSTQSYIVTAGGLDIIKKIISESVPAEVTIEQNTKSDNTTNISPSLQKY